MPLIKTALSSQTRDLISELYRKPTAREWLTGSRRTLDVLEAIANRAEPAATIDLLPLLFSNNSAVAQAAADTLHSLVDLVPPEQLGWLDIWVRHGQRTYYQSPWQALKPTDIRWLASFQNAAGSLIGLASFHGNGFVRQAAIDELKKSQDGKELRFLLLRLNDWVDTVRGEALEAVAPRIKPAYAMHFVESFALLLRLGSAGREDHLPFISAVERMLQLPASKSALEQGLASENRYVRRALYRVIAEAWPSHLFDWLERASRDHDPGVRIWAVNTAEDGLLSEQLQPILVKAWQDRFPVVRRRVLEVFARSLPDLSGPIASDGLLDRSAPVREQARGMLRIRGEQDFVSLYRRALADAEDTRTLEASIAGLGETGSGEDVASVAQYSTHLLPRIRRTSIAAIAKLKGSEHLPLFFNALGDEAPSVSKMAAVILAPRLTSIDPHALWKVFQDGASRHVRTNALHLISLLPKWERIPRLVQAVTDKDSEIARLAKEYVRRWLERFNQSFTAPTTDQLQALRDSLEKHRFGLDTRVYRELMFVAKD